ncbi:MAG: iron-sulfur cluster assembly scaffold protein [Elusimicrobia bacterium RIFCSPLOWO2_01_FULL_64_13]|nr:MAG: iron-sulfur cluster assembly scaffold protein [Elusimicrobia bacterium RIFCSPHIGHO2_01_FULL_64_10]OGR98116.1 MAG: iron-sulfur cluster assembly scaffold protein [Elusimicrobia bacterium RIFCSPLOWO2_01_FULL_64_13]
MTYSPKIVEHFTNPRNVGEIPNADGVGTVGHPVCGDVMRIYLKIQKKKGRPVITQAKFKTFGCTAAIATSSIATELVKGKTVAEALALKNEDVAKALGGLPPIKMHCSVLAEDAIKAAVADYEKKIGRTEIEKKLVEEGREHEEKELLSRRDPI